MIEQLLTDRGSIHIRIIDALWLCRKIRRMTHAELAEQVGVSRSTVRAIEHGGPKVEIGLFLEATVICGVTLFTDNPTEVARY